jgi:hypothetical protein
VWCGAPSRTSHSQGSLSGLSFVPAIIRGWLLRLTFAGSTYELHHDYVSRGGGRLCGKYDLSAASQIVGHWVESGTHIEVHTLSVDQQRHRPTQLGPWHAILMAPTAEPWAGAARQTRFTTRSKLHPVFGAVRSSHTEALDGGFRRLA